jgi:hypothetical protein
LVHCSHSLCDYLSHAACMSNGYESNSQWYCEACLMLAPRKSKTEKDSDPSLTSRRYGSDSLSSSSISIVDTL